MTGARATGVWAASFLDELNRAGVDTVCVAPGSRSTPLVLAAASQPGLRLVTHLDERSAAFFALGLGKASGRPAAVITTSGTAAANLLPAVVEASQGGVPLILLTADRPHRLRGADANQAIDQTHLYGRYVRRFVEAAPPSEDPAALRHLRILADRAVADATGSDPGPVHVNFPFDKPLEPASPAHVPGPAEGHSSGEPLTRVEFAHETPLDDQADAWTTMLAGARRPLIVAGYQVQPGRTGPAILGLAAAAGVPVLADPLSGARFGPGRGAARAGAAVRARPGRDRARAGQRPAPRAVSSQRADLGGNTIIMGAGIAHIHGRLAAIALDIPQTVRNLGKSQIPTKAACVTPAHQLRARMPSTMASPSTRIGDNARAAIPGEREAIGMCRAPG